MSNNDYYNKYIKYKIKYLKLSNMKGGFFVRAARLAATVASNNPEGLLSAAKNAGKNPDLKKRFIAAARNPELKKSLLAATKISASNPELKNNLLKAAAKFAQNNPKLEQELQRATNFANQNPVFEQGLANLANKHPALNQDKRTGNIAKSVSPPPAAPATSHAAAKQLQPAALDTTHAAAQAAAHTAVPATSHPAAKQLPPATYASATLVTSRDVKQLLPPAPHDNQEFVGRKICEEILQIQAPRTNLMISLNGICKLAKQ
jgi:hypothetical protein